jgi:hypothetical protein
MRRALLICFALLLSLTRLFPQITVERKIVWEQPVEITLPSEQVGVIDKRTVLRFKNSVINDQETAFPSFYELIPADESFRQLRITILEEVFEELNSFEKQALKGISIPQQVNYAAGFFRMRKRPFIQLGFLPIRINPVSGNPEKLLSFSLRLSAEYPAAQAVIPRKSSSWEAHSVLNTGKWVKIQVESDGIYQLTYSELLAMGFSNPEQVRVFGNDNRMLPLMNSEPRSDDLIETAVYFEKGPDNIFNQGDYLLFYGQGPVSWVYNQEEDLFEHRIHEYSDYNYYFLTSMTGTGRTVQTSAPPAASPNQLSQSFDDHQYHEQNLHNLIQSGRLWLGELFDSETSKNIPFEFPNLVSGSEVKVKSRFAARSSVNSSVSLSHGQQTLFSASISSVLFGSYTSNYANIGTGQGTFTASSPSILLTMNYSKPLPSSIAWLDYILVNARRQLIMSGNQMHFRDKEVAGTGNVTEFRLEGASQELRVWNITEPFNAKNIQGNLSGNLFSFKQATDSLIQFIAFSPSTFLKPVIAGPVMNQNLHGLGQSEMIIISHPDFLTQANRLADHRRTNNQMTVIVVTPEQIYNEFSSGKPDVAALRNFIKMFYDRAFTEDDMPRYLLLFGDGSYRNKQDEAGNSNFILTYQSENSVRPTLSFVSDDFFGLLDDDEGGTTGLLDIGIGRLPVTTSAQAQTYVDKIFRYENPENRGDWQNILCFIADDGDANIHMRDADILAEGVQTNYPVFNLDKIYLDAYQRISGPGGQRYPEANRAILDRINRGTLLVNYTGHGNEIKLADENIFDIGDILSLSNRTTLPVFMTATCEFSRFDNPARMSAGESLLLTGNGGGIALFSTTRLVYATPNFFLNQNFYKYIFEESDGGFHTFGDVMRLTKNASGTGINKLNFSLLGDPSMQLALPKYGIRITEINQNPADLEADTLKALGRYTIRGQVELNGMKATDYHGIVFPSVYDKSREITTLSNDGNPPFVFNSRSSIIYKGKSTVSGGEFSFTFYVPKDILYHYDTARVSTFATGLPGEASGSFSNLFVGGTADDILEDTEGPVIELYMNDQNFVQGGTTGENPVLIAFLSDSTGINTTGTGIGHDITLVLNENLNDPIILNDFYVANVDDFKTGTIEYPFNKLKEGSYQLRLKAWDVFNNSREEQLEFVVAQSARLALRNVLNYPNPFTAYTFFHFEHNQPGTNLDILIQIFTISGRLVKTIETTSFTTGFKPDPIPWDGLDDYGDRIGRGVYLYRVRIRAENGQSAEKYERLVILK